MYEILLTDLYTGKAVSESHTLFQTLNTSNWSPKQSLIINRSKGSFIVSESTGCKFQPNVVNVLFENSWYKKKRTTDGDWHVFKDDWTEKHEENIGPTARYAVKQRP